MFEEQAKISTSDRVSPTPEDQQNLLRSVQLRKAAQLTPKAAKLYNVACKSRRLSRRLEKQNKNNKQRVQAVLELANSGRLFQSRINQETYRFLQSQITQQRKSARGRRFSEEDKLLSLSLLKQSSRGYKLLRTIFALPSRRTLMGILSSVPFNKTAINPLCNRQRQGLLDKACRTTHTPLWYKTKRFCHYLISLTCWKGWGIISWTTILSLYGKMELNKQSGNT